MRNVSLPPPRKHSVELAKSSDPIPTANNFAQASWQFKSPKPRLAPQPVQVEDADFISDLLHFEGICLSIQILLRSNGWFRFNVTHDKGIFKSCSEQASSDGEIRPVLYHRTKD
ncbi:hypothetical protein CEXT_415711 [Caerostris extrusa]|uniref:Uncharacterized protein n=1 Tax=Caerostris extrusa TaxID=172846 RepID=A0AAV4SIX8_CAEEX|nr:hypothetical protein CEXT_415711 [Caerostris extrusa]